MEATVRDGAREVRATAPIAVVDGSKAGVHILAGLAAAAYYA